MAKKTGVLTVLPVETAEAGGKHLGFGSHGGGRGDVAALGAAAAAAGVLVLLLTAASEDAMSWVWMDPHRRSALSEIS